MKVDGYPMHRAARCTAHSKRTGLPCRNPAVRGWKVCRVHGAGGGAKPGPLCPAFRHGGRTGQAERLRKMVSDLSRDARELAAALGKD